MRGISSKKLIYSNYIVFIYESTMESEVSIIYKFIQKTGVVNILLQLF